MSCKEIEKRIKVDCSNEFFIIFVCGFVYSIRKPNLEPPLLKIFVDKRSQYAHNRNICLREVLCPSHA